MSYNIVVEMFWLICVCFGEEYARYPVYWSGSINGWIDQ